MLNQPWLAKAAQNHSLAYASEQGSSVTWGARVSDHKQLTSWCSCKKLCYKAMFFCVQFLVWKFPRISTPQHPVFFVQFIQRHILVTYTCNKKYTLASRGFLFRSVNGTSLSFGSMRSTYSFPCMCCRQSGLLIWQIFKTKLSVVLFELHDYKRTWQSIIIRQILNPLSEYEWRLWHASERYRHVLDLSHMLQKHLQVKDTSSLVQLITYCEKQFAFLFASIYIYMTCNQPTITHPHSSHDY